MDILVLYYIFLFIIQLYLSNSFLVHLTLFFSSFVRVSAIVNKVIYHIFSLTARNRPK
jgi:hypothetical protein